MAFDSKGTLNKVMLIGRLGQDPELKYTQSGVAVLQVSLATDTSWKDQDGNQQTKTEWHRVVTFGRLAEICGEYLSKGSKVYIEGRIQTRKWEDRDGNPRYTTEIVAREMKMLSPRGAGDEGQSAYGDEEPPLPDVPKMEDDVPF